MYSSSLLLLLLLITSSNFAWASDLILLNTKNARTFASSVEDGSSSDFATDEEVHYDQPTCFRSSPNTYDADEFSWLVVDLGSVIPKLTEVYMASGSKYGSDNVEVFVTTYMRTSAHINRSERSLIWDSYDECGRTTSDEHSGSSATVRCTHPLEGRWLILRRKSPQPLMICLLAVYITKTEDACLRTVNSNLISQAQGNEFRYERHISLEQCRESCIDTPSCQGLTFTKESRRGRSGDCRLFRGPEGSLSRENVDVDPEDGTHPINCGKWCLLEQNECNRGQVFPLIRRTEDVPYAIPGTTIWKLDDLKLQNLNPQMVKIFFALRFKGRILCEAESCGAIHILLVNEEGEETFCTSINTDLISTLDRYTIQCREAWPATNLGFDTVAIKMISSEVDQLAPKLEISEGHARFILIDKGRLINSISEIPISPEEFFVFPQHTTIQESVPATEEVEIPITLPEPSWRFRKPIPIFETNAVKQNPNQNVAVENPDPIITPEMPSAVSTEPAADLHEIDLNPKFDNNSIETEEQVADSDEDHNLDPSDNRQDGEELFDSENEGENLQPEPSIMKEDTLSLTKQEPDLNFAVQNLPRSFVDRPYVSEIDKPEHYNEPIDYKLDAKFDSIADPVRDFEPHFPSETLSNLKRADHESISSNPMQQDAEDSHQVIEPQVSKQSTNLTSASGASQFSPNEVQAAGSLSIINLIMITISVSVFIMAVVAGIVWFTCIRGK